MIATKRASTVNVRPVAGRVELFQRFRSERSDPDAFYGLLADRTIAEFPLPLTNRTVLDLGAGTGHYSAALQRAGADVIAVDLRESCVERVRDRGCIALRSDAGRLPLHDASVDGVFSSNLLEHTPDPIVILDEIERVLRPGGWAWVSWTNWYSPWGGHLITPFHFLGPRLGSRVHDRIKGPPARNAVYDGLWPTHINTILRDVRRRPGLELVSAVPRYYPSQRWILSVPGLREVATWNCLLFIERRSKV